MSDDTFAAEDYRFTAELLWQYAKGNQTDLFHAVCSNNLAIIIAALGIAADHAQKLEDKSNV